MVSGKNASYRYASSFSILPSERASLVETKGTVRGDPFGATENDPIPA